MKQNATIQIILGGLLGGVSEAFIKTPSIIQIVS